ncbi:hypothetical protein DFP78_108104 [Photobacterium lutimaris]|nr:hypothetical protein DFP78_108104 [Photobacterium lutimaris]
MQGMFNGKEADSNSAVQLVDIDGRRQGTGPVPICIGQADGEERAAGAEYALLPR